MSEAKQIAAIKKTLASLIAWMAGSANSPIRPDEARQLLEMLDKGSDK